ncbi:MAG: hypothetical protein R3E76_14825 [Planctomycetota bacterium]
MNLVEPRDASPRETVEQDLVGRGVPVADATWIAEFLVSISYAGSSALDHQGYDEQLLLDRLDKPVRVAAELFERASGNRDRAILWLLATLPGISPRYMLDDSAVRLTAVGGLVWRSEAGNPYLQNQARFRARAAIVLAFLRYVLQHAQQVDFDDGLKELPLDLRPDSPVHPVSIIAGRLLLTGRVALREHLDYELVAASQYQHSDNDAHGDPRRLEFWFDASVREWECLWPSPRRQFRKSTWPWLASLFAATDTDSLGALAVATWRSYRRWLWVRTRNELLVSRRSWIFREDQASFDGRQERDVEAANDLSAGIAQCANLLAARVPEAGADWELPAATGAYCFRAYFQRSGSFSPAARDATAAAATELLGRMRSLLSDPQANSEEFSSRADAYTWAIQYLAGLSSMWAATKPLLLALRALATPAVSSDLRYWHVPDKPEPPRPWAWLPETLSSVPHTFARLVERKDPELLSFKAELAGYCLDRLKSRKTDSGDGQPQLLEPDSIWRHAYVRAFMELGVNPKGRARKLLSWSSEHDPDPEVRKAASDAVSGLNSRPDEGRSHRRGIFAAFWWLRQAHFLSLGGELDVAGAQRTFRREVQRTNERRKTRNS